MRPFVWLSTQDLDDVWTRKQRFAQLFARRGHRVLYVEAPTHLLTYARAFPRSLARVRRAAALPVAVEPNLHRLTLPPLLPYFQRWDALNEIDARVALAAIRRGVRSLGLEAPIVWAYPPYAAPVVEALERRLAVYDCVDEWSSFSGLLSADTVRRQEKRLLAAVDLVVVTTESLLASKGPLARRAAVVPNAADAEHFRQALDPATAIPADLARLPGPRIGFVGGVQYWIDFPLLEAVAQAHPGASLALVGPVGRLADVDRLRALPNVHFLGLRPYPLLPGYLKGFDVCLNPFRLDETGAHVSPLKLFEYLAAGKSVVSVDLPAVRPFAGVVRIARSAPEFVTLVSAALDERRQGLDRDRVAGALAIAGRNTWQARFERVLEVLGEALA